MSVQDVVLIAPVRMKSLARRLGKVLGLSYDTIGSRIFPDGEMEMVLEAPVHNKKVIFLFETKPPHIHRKIFELQNVLELLRQRGVSSIHIIFTYMAYLRQDEGSSMLTVLSKILKDATVSVVEPHAEVLKCNYISVNDSIAHFLKYMNNPLLIAPDKGASARVIALASLLDTDFLILEKTRFQDEVHVNGNELGICKGRSCVIVDDILSTGQTLLKTSALIHRYEASSLTAVIVHNLAKPRTRQHIKESGVRLISCSDQATPQTIDITPALVAFVRAQVLGLPEQLGLEGAASWVEQELYPLS